MAATADWASLPDDVACFILDRMFDPMHHVRFAAVCKDWRAVSKTYNEITKRWRRNNNILPMLLVPSSDDAKSKIGSRLLYSIADARVANNIELTLPYLNNNSTIKCFGSHRDNGGWLATVDLMEGDRHHLNITLVNPFRKQVSPIRLPPLKFDQFIDNFQSLPTSHGQYPKVILFGDPTLNPDGFAVVAIFNNPSTLLPWIKGRQSVDWTYLQPNLGELRDAIFYKNKVYVLGRWGGIGALDIPSSKITTHRLCNPKEARVRVFDKLYLVESTKGDLYHVHKFMVQPGYFYLDWPEGPDGFNQKRWTTGFVVFKVVFNAIDGSIFYQVEVDSIGEEAFFLGDNRSLSVLASDFLNCQRNSIYYTDDFFPIGQYGRAPAHMSIFNLDDKTITEQNWGGPNSIRPAIWTIPPYNGL